MFCPNCGNQVIEGKKFCITCGEKIEGLSPAQPDETAAPTQPVSAAAPAPEVNPTPVSQPVNTAIPTAQTPQPRQPRIQYQVIQQKPKSHVWIVVLITILVLAIAAGVTLFILKPWDNGSDSGYSSSDENNPDNNPKNGGEKPAATGTEKGNTPVVEPEKNNIPSTPFITINGERIPVEVSGFYRGRVDTGTDGVIAVLAGNKGSKVYCVMIGFFTDDYPDYPSADSEYDINSDGDKIIVSFSYEDLSTERRVNIVSCYTDELRIDKFLTGAYIADNKLELFFSGKATEDGLAFNFSAGGCLEFYPGDLEEAVEEWYEALKEKEKPNVPTTVEIDGETYPVSTTFIDLSNKGLYDKDIENIKYLTKLTRAELSGNNLTDISVLEGINTLEEIDATDNNISDISFMKNLPNLKIVVMNNNPISDISVFKNLTTLQKLWLCDCNISDISPIAKNKGMIELGFNNSYIGDISALKGMNKLELLCLYNCGISDISVLSTCTGLKKLYMGSNFVTDFSPLDNLELEEAALYD